MDRETQRRLNEISNKVLSKHRDKIMKTEVNRENHEHAKSLVNDLKKNYSNLNPGQREGLAKLEKMVSSGQLVTQREVEDKRTAQRLDKEMTGAIRHAIESGKLEKPKEPGVAKKVREAQLRALKEQQK